MNHSVSRSITGVDTHAHIFRRDLPMVENRRYTPEYDALVETHLENIDGCGLSHGVLVQPSFLGTDNSFITDALKRFPDRLRGIAVVDKEISNEELDALDTAGFVGIRLNLIGRELENYGDDVWQSLFKRLAERNWQVEVQRGVDDLYKVLPDMVRSGVQVVVDHFGRPDGAIDKDNSAHRAFLEILANENVWLKVSAPYRAKANPQQASELFAAYAEAAGGVDRFLWGSDWPNTQFEKVTNYSAQFALFTDMVTDPQQQHQILVDNPVKLFRF